MQNFALVKFQSCHSQWSFTRKCNVSKSRKNITKINIFNVYINCLWWPIHCIFYRFNPRSNDICCRVNSVFMRTHFCCVRCTFSTTVSIDYVTRKLSNPCLTVINLSPLNLLSTFLARWHLILAIWHFSNSVRTSITESGKNLNSSTLA